MDVIGEPKSFKTHFSNMPQLLVISDPVHNVNALITVSTFNICIINKKHAADG